MDCMQSAFDEDKPQRASRSCCLDLYGPKQQMFHNMRQANPIEVTMIAHRAIAM
jgi:hypothetical protein